MIKISHCPRQQDIQMQRRKKNMKMRIGRKVSIALSVVLAVTNLSFAAPVIAGEMAETNEAEVTTENAVIQEDFSFTGKDFSKDIDGSVLADFDASTGKLRIYPKGSGNHFLAPNLYNRTKIGQNYIANDVTEIVVEKGIEAPKYSGRMFASFPFITSIDLRGLDTSNAEHMGLMFLNCQSLRNLDISSFDTSKVTDMYGMFDKCSSLTNLDISSFDTSKVTDMNQMFKECSSLTNLDVSRLDTSKVTDMYQMFAGCESLTSLDVSGFNTSNVTDMRGMFCNCKSLTSLDVSRFDTSNVTDMNRMFSDCESLTSLDASSFDTSRVTDMCYIFSNCKSLTSLDVGGFDTSNVTNMHMMFEGCKSLTSLDVSRFNTSKVTEMCAMFSGCRSLTSLDVSRFDTSNVTVMSYMFFGCDSLTSIDLGNFDMSAEADGYVECNIIGSKNLRTIRTPKKARCHTRVNVYGTWQDEAGNEYKYMPLDGSKTLHRTDLPEEPVSPSDESGTNTPSSNDVIREKTLTAGDYTLTAIFNEKPAYTGRKLKAEDFISSISVNGNTYRAKDIKIKAVGGKTVGSTVTIYIKKIKGADKAVNNAFKGMELCSVVIRPVDVREIVSSLSIYSKEGQIIVKKDQNGVVKTVWAIVPKKGIYSGDSGAKKLKIKKNGYSQNGSKLEFNGQQLQGSVNL